MLELDLQLATDGQHPDEAQLRRWCELALRQRTADSELTIRLVDEEEGRELNRTWRHKDYATNVLSFPAEIPEGILDIPLLGDLVICCLLYTSTTACTAAMAAAIPLPAHACPAAITAPAAPWPAPWPVAWRWARNWSAP